ALSAGKLMRIAREPRRRLRNADLRQQLDDAGARWRAGQALMQQERLADLLLNGVQRIERGHRLLEDDGNAIATHATQRAFRQLEQVLALELNGAGGMAR